MYSTSMAYGEVAQAFPAFAWLLNIQFVMHMLTKAGGDLEPRLGVLYMYV